MKFALLATSLFFTSFALAQESPAPISLSCLTEVPTTTFVMSTVGKDLEVLVMHSNGSSYAPSINGVFTPADLPLLTERSLLVEKMKDVMLFRWPMKNCTRHSEQRFECFGTDDVQLGKGGEKIQPFAIYTAVSTEEGIGGKWDYLTVNLSFKVDGKGDPSLSMKYLKTDCGLN